MVLNEYIIKLIAIAIFIVLLLLADFVFFIFNKKLNYKNRLAKVLQMLPEFILQAEKNLGAGNGLSKLAFVLQNVHLKCLELKLDYNEDEWKYEIEKILDTPQKKLEVKDETSENA